MKACGKQNQVALCRVTPTAVLDSLVLSLPDANMNSVQGFHEVDY
jgi:hypothetical protein